MKLTFTGWHLGAWALPVVASALLAPSLLAQPSLSISGTSVAEGDAGSVQAVVTVTLTPAASGDVTVSYESSQATPPATGGDSCGRSGIDFERPTGILQFDPGVTSQTISVTVCGDTAQELDEKFRVRLFGAQGATIATSQGAVTILDDDDQPPPPPPLPSVSIDDVSFPEGNVGAVKNTTVRLSATSSQPVTVTMSILPGTATGGSDCLLGNDFRVSSPGSVFPRTLTINPGANNPTVSFIICGDTTFEPDETFSVGLSNPSGATLGDAVGQVTILNDDAPQPLTLTLDGLLVQETSSGQNGATMHASLLSPAPVAFVLAPTVGPISVAPPGETVPTGGADCTLGVDFLTHIDPVSIAVGQTPFTFDVVICGDTQSETTERLLVKTPTLTTPVIMDGKSAILEIRDDDLPTVSVRDTTILEGDIGTPEGKYTLTLSEPATAPVRVDLVVQGGTATFGSGCTGAADFKSVVRGTVEFSPSQTNRQISFNVCSDLNAERDEIFSVTLARPSGAVLGDRVGQITIQNDDLVQSEDLVSPVVPLGAELVVELVALSTQTAPNLAFGVRARNTGSLSASNVPVLFQLPKDVAFVGLEENTMGTCLQNSTSADGALQVNCTVPLLPAGGNRGVRILGKTPDSAIAGSTELVYSARIDSGNTVPEGNELNNSALGFTTVLTPADLRVRVVTPNGLTLTGRGGGETFLGTTVEDFPCFASGAVLSVKLTVSNLGPNQTPRNGIVASWPSGYVSSGISCFEFCFIPSLNPGRSTTVDLAGLYNGEGVFAEGEVRFRLGGDAVFDPTPGNNTATLGLTNTACGG